MTVNDISRFTAVFRGINTKYINNIPTEEHAPLQQKK